MIEFIKKILNGNPQEAKFNHTRIQRELRTAVRYSIVGLLATTVHIFTAWLLLTVTALPTLAANTLAFLIAFIFSFSGNYAWTFKSTGKLAKTIKRSLLISVIAFTVNTVLLTFLVHGGWFSPVISTIFSAAIVPVITFLSNRFWAFQLNKETV